ncbi:translation initiation factor 2 [Brevundimonas sp.]|uniref:translation initiation factor 2 n=1 Tax=Brevundimonas sp. TaxID=1871086 RepID=UPI0035B2CC01
MKTITVVAAIAAALSLSACATVTRGTNTAWEVTSVPTGAEVHTSNGFHCEATPCAIKMPRKSEFVATLTMDGYEPATITVTNKVGTGGGTAMAGNVLVGGLIGAVVDGSSGAMLDLTPNPATVTLQAQRHAEADQTGEQ